MSAGSKFGKKTILIFAILCLFTSGSKAGDTGYKWGLMKTDSVLCELLNIPINDPFLTDTIRHDYLRLGCSRVSAIVDIAPIRQTLSGIGVGISMVNFSSITNPVKITGVIRDVDTDSAYSLIEIKPGDVGQKEIATSSPVRYYWWEFKIGDNSLDLYIYPPVTSGTATITVFAFVSTNDFTAIKQIAHDKIILYALYKCYFQKEETDMADKIKEICETLLFDQKDILENRPIDITIKKEVLSK